MTATATIDDHEHAHFNTFLETVFISLGGWFLYVITDTLTKWLAQSYPVSELIFLVYGAGFVGTAAYIALRYGPRALIPEKFRWFLLRGVSGAVGALLGAHALKRIPLADFYGIVFLTPLLLCLLSHFVLKERIGKHRISAIGVGFAGVIVLAGPQFTSGNIGYLLALACTLFSAINGIVTRKIGKTKIISTFALYPFLCSALLNVPIMMLEGGATVPAWDDIPLFLIVPPLMLLGLLAYGFSFSRVRETAMIAPFHYSQIVWGALIGYFLFGNVPEPHTIAGATIIIGAGLYMIWREHALHKATVMRNLQR